MPGLLLCVPESAISQPVAIVLCGTEPGEMPQQLEDPVAQGLIGEPAAMHEP